MFRNLTRSLALSIVLGGLHEMAALAQGLPQQPAGPVSSAPTQPMSTVIAQRAAEAVRLQLLVQENREKTEQDRFLVEPQSGSTGSQDSTTLVLASAPLPVMTLSGSVSSGNDTKFPVTFSMNPFRMLGASAAWSSLTDSSIKVVYAPLVIKQRIPGQSQQIGGAKTGTAEYAISFPLGAAPEKKIEAFKALLGRMNDCVLRECADAELMQMMVEGTAIANVAQNSVIDRRVSIGLSGVYGVDNSAGPDTVVLSAVASRGNFGQVVAGKVLNPITLSLTGSWTRYQGVEQRRFSILGAADRVIREGLAFRFETRRDQYYGGAFVIPGRTDSRNDDWGLSQIVSFRVLNDKNKKLSLAFKQLHVGSSDLEFSVGVSYSAQIGS